MADRYATIRWVSGTTFAEGIAEHIGLKIIRALGFFVTAALIKHDVSTTLRFTGTSPGLDIATDRRVDCRAPERATDAFLPITPLPLGAIRLVLA